MSTTPRRLTTKMQFGNPTTKSEHFVYANPDGEAHDRFSENSAAYVRRNDHRRIAPHTDQPDGLAPAVAALAPCARVVVPSIDRAVTQPRSVPVHRRDSAGLALLAARPLSGARAQVLARHARPASSRRARGTALCLRRAASASLDRKSTR